MTFLQKSLSCPPPFVFFVLCAWHVTGVQAWSLIDLMLCWLDWIGPSNWTHYHLTGSLFPFHLFSHLILFLCSPHWYPTQRFSVLSFWSGACKKPIHWNDCHVLKHVPLLIINSSSLYCAWCSSSHNKRKKQKKSISLPFDHSLNNSWVLNINHVPCINNCLFAGLLFLPWTIYMLMCNLN